MIQIKRPEPSNNGAGQSSPGLEKVEIVAMARKRPSRMVRGDRALRGPAAGFLPGGGAIRRNRAGMVGETTMSQRNGSSTAPSERSRQGHGRIDARHRVAGRAAVRAVPKRLPQGLKGLLLPAALLLLAGIVAAGTVPVALMVVAELLAQAAGLSRAASFSIAALGGFGVAVALGVAGWSRIRGVGRVFERSREELARNMNWIKQSLKRPVEAESPQKTFNQ